MQAAVEDVIDMEQRGEAEMVSGEPQLTNQMQVQRAAAMARIAHNARQSIRVRTVAAANPKAKSGDTKAPPPRPHADSELPLSLQQAELLA